MTKEIFTDGSGDSRGTSALCIIRKNWPDLKRKEQKVVQIIQKGLNVYDIETMAVSEAVKLIPLPLFGQEPSVYIIYNDNMGIVSDLNNPNTKKDSIKKIQEMITARGGKIEVRWVSREKNPAGIYLERRLKKINGYLRASVGKRRHNKIYKLVIVL
jgi:hypothetical protein